MEHSSGMGGWLRITFLVVLAILGGIAATLSYVAFNPDSLKPVASYLTERFLGRALTIDGEVTLDLSLQPTISVRNARFANAAWSNHPDMVKVDFLEVQIDLPDLLDNRVRLLDLNVKDAELVLEDPADGRPNWSFSNNDSDDDGEEADWSFLLEGLEVTHVTLRAQFGELEPLLLEVPQLIESTDTSSNLTLNGEGRLNGEAWKVQGHIGTFDQLLAAGRIELALDLLVDDVTLSLSGAIGNLQQLTGLDLTLQLNGPDADLLGVLFHMPEAFAGDVALKASIKPSGDTHRIVLDGHVAQFSVDTMGTVREIATLDGWNGHVGIKGPDAGVIGKALQLSGLPGGPFEVTGNVERDGGVLNLNEIEATFAGASLTLSADFKHFPDPTDAQIDAKLTGEDLRFYRTFLRLPEIPEALPFDFTVALEAGSSRRLTASFTAGSHTLETTGSVGPYPDFDGTRLSLTASGAEFAELTHLAGLDAGPSGPYSAHTEVTLANGRLSAESTRLDVAPFQFSGNIGVPDISEPRRLTVTGTLAVQDLVRAGALFQVDNLPEGALSVTADVASDGRQWRLAKASGQTPIGDFSASGALGSLTSTIGIELTVDLQGPDIRALFDRALPDVQAIPFTVSSRIRGAESAIELEDFQLRTEGGALDLDSRIGFAAGFVGSHITLKGHGIDLANLLPSFPDYRPPHQPWEIDGRLSIPSADHVEIEDGSLQVGSVKVDASGVVDTRNQDQTNLSLSVSGDSIDELGQIGTLDWPKMPFSVVARLDGSTNEITIKQLDAQWGDSDLKATGALELTDKPRIVLEGKSSSLKIGALQQALFGDEETTSENKPTRYIPDTPIPLELLTRLDLNLAVNVDQFEGRRLRLNDVDVSIRIQDGGLHLDRVRYRDQRGFFDTSGSLLPSGAPGVAQLMLSMKGENADLGLFTATDQPPETRPTYNLDISIQGIGTTVAELAGSLDGSLLVWSDGGKISNNIIQTYASDFLVKVLETLNPFTKSEPFTQVQCLVLNADIDQGKVNLQPGFVMRTASLNMFVVGDVNLKTERLNVSLATHARQGIGISAATLTNPYFKVGGTLASPALQLDAQSAAIAASVTAATAGLNIVIKGVWSRLRGEQDPCPQFLHYERKSAADKQAEKTTRN